MARISYDQLPPEGAKFPRDISRVLNQVMQGQQNNVLDVLIPAGGLDSGTFTVFDSRVSNQKWVQFMPLDVDTLLVINDMFVSGLRNGEFDISVVPIILQRALTQVTATAAAGPDLLGGAKIPFDTVNFDQNFFVDTGNDQITVLTNTTLRTNFTLSGTYNKGTEFTFGVRVVSGPNTGSDFTVQTSTSNQNDVVSVSGSVVGGLNAGDVLEFFGIADKSNNLDPFSLVWNIAALDGPLAIEPGDGPFNLRTLIIG